MERNEAIESLRLLYSATNAENKAALECLIPELKESEDERIRKEIIHYILYKADGVSEEQEHSWVAYLEKQKEQKPVEWSEEDEKMRLSCIDIIEHFPIPSGAVVYGPWSDCIDWLKSLRSRPKSSDNWKPNKEQMKALSRCILIGNEDMIDALKSLCDDLKKLI